MKTSNVLIFSALICAGMIGCGGGSASGSADLSAQAPTYDLVALGVTESDSAAPADSDVTDDLSSPASDVTGDDDPCHPHLFVRTRQVVHDLNVLSYKLMHHVAEVIGNAQGIQVGETETWEKQGPLGLQRKFTLTKTGAGAFSFELDFAAASSSSAAPDWQTVLTGNLTRTPSDESDAGASASAVTETKGSVTFDFTALAAAVPSELESGQIGYQFDEVHDPSKPAAGTKLTDSVNFVNFKLRPNDPHGPRNGSYVFAGEAGNGGTLAYQDSIALLCPANPSALDAATVIEARWYFDANGALHGRADAKASGGQIASGDTWEGVACHTGAPPDDGIENGYWMMKLEDAGGTTIQGSAHERASSTVPCDPAFGAVPLLDSDANDLTFGGTLSFPGEW